MTEPSHFENFVEHLFNGDDSEISKVQAERDYALHCLEREIGIAARTQAAFLRYLQNENGCQKTGTWCRQDHNKCGCYLELQGYYDAESPADREGK